MPNAPVKPDEITLTLALLNGQLTDIVNPNNMLAEIEDILDDLDADQVDPHALDTIAENAVSLLDMASNLRRTAETAINTARSLKKSMDELKRGLETCDTDIPEIAQLQELIESDLYDSAWWQDMGYEDAIENIAEGSGLEWGEAQQLWELLTGGGINGDSSLWAELREWMDRAERAARRWDRQQIDVESEEEFED
jgi:hypothetical protein